ncbi:MULTISPECIES: LexA family protein [unclassified Clostridium]|uniref:LexA family protein n=1 Tax=unclassified Clostridium TaxID=2614128 RepID=UPI00290ED8B7|nr:winged helix DNA-binding protein [Clostridium sp.]MDU5106548.1 winged helix DNA-binding protein [Clostridium sp.]
MTERQHEILNMINEYINKERISPTVREICDIAGLKSSATVHRHIKVLQNKGYIQMIKNSPRSMRVVKELA